MTIMPKSGKRAYRNPRVLALIEDYGGRVRDPEKIIIRLAQRITKAGHAVSPPPFLPEFVAENLNVRDIIAKDLLPVDASLVDKGGYYIIHYASDISRGRRNFSAFHEMAHILFNEACKRQKPFLTADERTILSKSYQEEERLCNVAATEFLLPLKIFRESLRGKTISWRSIGELSKRFEASLEATARRVGEVYNSSLLIIRWKLVGGDHQASIICCSPDLWRFAKRIVSYPTPPAVAAAAQSGGDVVVKTSFFLRGHEVPFNLHLKRQSSSGDAQEILGLYIEELQESGGGENSTRT